MIKYILTILLSFIIIQNTSLSQDDESDSIGWELVETETKFILNNAKTAAEVIIQLGEPDDKSKNEMWMADGLKHQTWYYRAKGLEIGFITDNTKTQTVNSITIIKPSDIKTGRSIGIGNTKEEVLKAYDKEIGQKDKWEGAGSLVAGSLFGGVVFTFEEGKVVSVFIGAAAE